MHKNLRASPRLESPSHPREGTSARELTNKRAIYTRYCTVYQLYVACPLNIVSPDVKRIRGTTMRCALLTSTYAGGRDREDEREAGKQRERVREKGRETRVYMCVPEVAKLYLRVGQSLPSRNNCSQRTVQADGRIPLSLK